MNASPNRRQALTSLATGSLTAPAILGAGLGLSGCATPAASDSGAVPKPRPRDRRKYEELLPEEFYEERARRPAVYLPIGAMEEHGLQWQWRLVIRVCKPPEETL